jgi:hypothetical protein
MNAFYEADPLTQIEKLFTQSTTPQLKTELINHEYSFDPGEIVVSFIPALFRRFY